MKYYLSICAIFRNEAEYLKEWIEFHRLVGVDHFYLYNNLSADNYFAVLKQYTDSGIVNLHDWSESWKKETQTNAYRHCLDKYKHESRWIAFIDLDEFLFSPGDYKITGILKDFENFPGVVINWQVYGSSGYKNRPCGLVIENFTQKAKSNWIRNKRIKSIVNPVKVLTPKGPHLFEYKNGELAVTENFEPVKITRSSKRIKKIKRIITDLLPWAPLDPYAGHEISIKKVSVNALRINHYIVKSREEAMEEIESHSNLKHTHRMKWFKYHDRNEVRDDILHRYLPELMKKFK